MPSELEAVPVGYNPFADPSSSLAAGAGTLPQDPAVSALETGANLQRQRFSLAPVSETEEGFPYVQAGNQPSFPETGPTDAVQPSSQPPQPVESAPTAPAELAGKPLVLSTRQTPWDRFVDAHAARTGVDPNLMRRIMQIESSGDPNSTTGSYRGLFQLSPQEFAKWGGRGSIYNPEQNTIAAANKIAGESKAFRERYGRDPTPTDIYMVHQQGEAGYARHMARPDQPAWRNMYLTAEGQQKGPLWAQRAIWGNVPTDLKRSFGNVNNVTSRDFVNLWRNKVEGGQMPPMGQFSGEQALPLPGQSRGLGPTAGPTVTSTMAAEDVPPPVTNRVGETFPTFALRNVAQSALTGIPDLSRLARQESMRAAEGDPGYNPQPALHAAQLAMQGTAFNAPRGALGSGPVLPALRQPPTVAPAFHSAVGKAIEAARQPKASPEQWLGMLKNTPGVKPEEMQWLGLEDWLKSQKGPVTKEQVADYVRGNQVELKEVTKGASPLEMRARELAEAENGPGSWDRIGGGGQEHYWRDARREMPDVAAEPTKFGSYQLPGGENYREMLLTMPDKGSSKLADLELKVNAGTATLPERQEYNSLVERGQQYFRGSHWDEPNVLAHVRFNDRTIDGKKTLFLEEIQSDWHQAGKKQGYAVPEGGDAFHLVSPSGQRGPIYRGEENARIAASNRGPDWTIAPKLQGNIPDAPFKTTWPELALKRMIRHAAENGYDKIAWTNGETQAARYDLSKHVKEIEYIKYPDGSYRLGIVQHNGEGLETPQFAYKPEELPNVVGKEVADKIVAGEGKKYRGHDGTTLEGLDLKVGGEGMKGFYDKMLPAMANKLGKKFGARVGQEEMIVEDHPQKGLRMSEPVHTMDITPALRDSAIQQGFPQFAKGGGVLTFVPIDYQPRFF